MPKRGRPFGVQEYREPLSEIDPVLHVLRKMRFKKKLSQADFADHAGYAVSAVQRWERGKNTPKLSNLHILAQALGVRIAVVDANGRAIDDVDV
jgi:transcriptional regulator with XRE-family HTH domain